MIPALTLSLDQIMIHGNFCCSQLQFRANSLRTTGIQHAAKTNTRIITSNNFNKWKRLF